MTDGHLHVEALGRRSRQAAIISLAGFLLVLGAIGLSVHEIDQLETRKQKLQGEIAALDIAIKVKTEKLDGANATIDRAAGQAAIDDLPGVRAALAQQVPPQGPPVGVIDGRPAPQRPNAGQRRVYFQIRDAGQKDLYAQCSRALVSDGYKVPPLELIRDRGPKASELRYFRANETSEANRLGDRLNKCLGQEIKVVLVRGKGGAPVVRPLQFEVWLAPTGQ